MNPLTRRSFLAAAGALLASPTLGAPAASGETDVAIVLIHHMSRGGTFRGSTAIRAACDQEFAFRRPEETELNSTEVSGTLTVEGRFGPRQRLGIRLGEDLRWQLSVQALSGSPSSRSQVLEHLTAAPG